MLDHLTLNSLEQDMIFLAGANACGFDDDQTTSDTAWLLEGFAVLADMTGDSKWRDAYASCTTNV